MVKQCALRSYLCGLKAIYNTNQSRQFFRMNKITILFKPLLCLLLLFPLWASAQNGTIKGFVYDKKTGEPLIYSSVLVADSKIGVQTDVNGYFSLSLPSGTYTLITVALGYDSSTTTVNVLPDAIIPKKIYVSSKEKELTTFVVSGRKTEKTTRINTGVTKITPVEMKTTQRRRRT
ncbi:MAG: carboxypeptidase-like regulatory domain-containing protein [Chitinophagia bacterium]|nr:carboxypeptidase-like regulatory domain-containing protein [Chitinophagia bacterium]